MKPSAPKPHRRRGFQLPGTSAPRRVAHGIRLKTEVFAADQPPVRRWLSLLERAIPAAACSEGLTYARSGQVAEFAIEPGRIRAQVQGRGPRPYDTVLALPVLAGRQWDTLIETMAAEAIYVARLLGGEVPSELEDLFQHLGLELLPVEPASLRVECSCTETKPCKHAAAVAYLVAERLGAEPLLTFTLRGMRVRRLLDRLRQMRAMHTQGAARAHADPLIPQTQVPAPPLEMCLDEFWRPGPELSELAQAPPPGYAPHALLRRLGQVPLSGSFPFVGLLASVYDAVSESTE